MIAADETDGSGSAAVDIDGVRSEGAGNESVNEPPMSHTDCNQKLTYGIDDSCPIYIAVLYGIQNLLENAAGILAVVFIIHGSICGSDDKALFAEMVSAYIFLLGFGTLIQVTFGVRMPILEGVSYAYLGPVVAFMSTQTCKTKCMPDEVGNSTAMPLTDCVDQPWREPLLEISGSLMLAAGVQTLLGLTGAIGLLLRFVSSLTIAITVGLLGLSLSGFISSSAGNQWGIALLTFALYCIFALLLARVNVPLPTWSTKQGCHLKPVPLFRTFPSLLALGFSWLFCYILTETDVFTDNPDRPSYQARTDFKKDYMKSADWFSIPYPGQYGLPTVGVGLFVGFLGSIIASTIESIGDYYAFSRACQLPPPPQHTVNRGIAVEGLISMLCGASGICLGTTSYSYVSGIVTVTGMGCRMGWQIVGVVFMVAGLVGKLGAALSMVPDPVIAGFNIVGIGMITAVGLSCLQFVDLKSVRNLAILGSCLMLGLAVPQYVMNNPGIINTGFKDLNQVLTILLTTHMTVGGVASFLLDNIIPGTKEERGLLTHSKLLQARVYSSEPLETQIRRAYDFPHITDWLRRSMCCRSTPFMPSYDENLMLYFRKKTPSSSSSSPDGVAHDNRAFSDQ